MTKENIKKIKKLYEDNRYESFIEIGYGFFFHVPKGMNMSDLNKYVRTYRKISYKKDVTPIQEICWHSLTVESHIKNKGEYIDLYGDRICCGVPSLKSLPHVVRDYLFKQGLLCKYESGEEKKYLHRSYGIKGESHIIHCQQEGRFHFMRSFWKVIRWDDLIKDAEKFYFENTN